MNSHLEHFEEFARRSDKQKRKQRYYYGLLLNWLKYLVPEGRSVLELGCADGEQLMALKPKHAVGIDFSQGLISAARKKFPEQTWILHDLTKTMPPIATDFDYIIGADIIGYLQDIQGGMEEIVKLCNPETRLILTKVNPFWGPLLRLANLLHLAEARRYSNWLSLKQSSAILELAGFEVVRRGKFCFLPFYVPLLSNLFNRYLSHLPLLNRLALVEYLVCRRQPVASNVVPSLSVVIPARNEKGNIRAALERMPRFSGALEVIFVEGHSNDGTWEEIQSVMQESWPFRIKGYQQSGKGKGDAVRLGFSQAEHDILMILDADLTVAPEELPRFYEILAARRAEYVHGTRLVYPMESAAMRPLNWIGNKTFSAIFSFLLGQQMTDTLCGTKCMYRADYLKLVAGRSYFGEFDPFGDFDLIFGAAKMGLKIAEIPVHYHARVYGSTQIRRFRDGILLFKMCWFAARKIFFI